MQRTSIALALLTVLACGCNSGPAPFPASGACTPTCAGGATASFAAYKEAKDAFTRMSEDEVLVATLEDAAWLRYEGDPETVQANHRAYFEYGYTTFQVVLRAKEFSQPTKEEFVLEDSAGARVVGRPVTYQGALKPAGDRWEYTFTLSFQHAITSDLRWLKLTRVADGAFVEWTFPGA
jgi:hypothetical protein